MDHSEPQGGCQHSPARVTPVSNLLVAALTSQCLNGCPLSSLSSHSSISFIYHLGLGYSATSAFLVCPVMHFITLLGCETRVQARPSEERQTADAGNLRQNQKMLETLICGKRSSVDVGTNTSSPLNALVNLMGSCIDECP